MTDNSYLVLGSGMMGYALAFDLAHSSGTGKITLADIDLARARNAVKSLGDPKVSAAEIDVDDNSAVIRMMREHDVAIGAVSYRVNAALTAAAIEAGTHFCDLGGNDAVVREQMRMHDAAIKKGVIVIPNCGLAPGLVNIMGVQGSSSFDQIDSIRLRVGGLPKNPRPPFNYQIVFSVEGLLNEYSGKSVVLRNGRVANVEAMSELEEFEIAPLGKLEAFHTSGGASFLPQLLEGKVGELDYRTIRYPGHCERMRTLLELGFAEAAPISIGGMIMTEKELFIELLKRRIPSEGPDLVVLRVTIEGKIDGKRKRRQFDCVDFLDELNNISAMMRGTSYPTSLIAQQITSGRITARGVLPPEQSAHLEPLLDGLRQRGMDIKDTWYDIS
jgi:lysine 6-dehydrogenase